ncbi:tyrosine-type recombinase/integrase [Candidatus Methanoperedens nitratireducens]|uniref:Tyr recombinase domain-containing protein n=1 Tax=Candidatus Methanoperedens nitratireducens TaxID=1392998 RepID=A0A284VM93_9EURY|nr:site-specific integrase [Candidatus Methanoperedens nitroreducens]SNQ60374.1 conserved hypothetical protein [Candidatus Methanoperedens nitroreducens]
MNVDIESDPKLQKAAALLELSDGTKHVYFYYMQKFCDLVGKTPTELIDESYAELKQGILPAERKSTDYILAFRQLLKDMNQSSNTVNTALSAIMSFYRAFDVELSYSVGKLKRAKPYKENQCFLKKEDVKKLIINAKNLRDKAIFLTMATSGLARTEIINLKVNSIEYDSTGIGIVQLRRQKTHTDFCTFISPEARIAIDNYLDERSRIEKLKPTTNDYLFVSYMTGSQLNKEYFTQIFNNLGKELGYTNGRYMIKTRSHSLRKFFSSTLENAGCPKPKVDYLLGHYKSASDVAYFDSDPDVLKTLYIKYLPFLTFEKNIEMLSLDNKDAKRLAELENMFAAMQEALGLRQTADGKFTFEAKLRELPDDLQKKHGKKFAVVTTEELEKNVKI